MISRRPPSSRLREPAAARNDVGDAARAIQRYVKDEIRRATELKWARVGAYCDGLHVVDFLDETDCGGDNGSFGPLVLAANPHGIPVVVTQNVARPFAGNVTGVRIETGGLPAPAPAGTGTGRYFVDLGGNLYEGRNGGYHAGGSPFAVGPNGTFITENGAIFPTFSTAYQYGADTDEAELFTTERVIHGVDELEIGWTIHPTHVPWLDGYSVLMAPNGVFALFGWLYPYLGLSSQSGTGYRHSSNYLVGVEAKYVPGGDTFVVAAPGAALDPGETTLVLGLSVRNKVSLGLTAWATFPELYSYVMEDGPSALFSALRSSGRWWEAKLRSYPAADGTFVLSYQDAPRAWVVEWAGFWRILETVDFSQAPDGHVAAIFG